MEQHHNEEQRQAEMVETRRNPARDTGWLAPRVAELDQRFGINSPELVARALGVSETVVRRYFEAQGE